MVVEEVVVGVKSTSNDVIKSGVLGGVLVIGSAVEHITVALDNLVKLLVAVRPTVWLLRKVAAEKYVGNEQRSDLRVGDSCWPPKMDKGVGLTWMGENFTFSGCCGGGGDFTSPFSLVAG